LEYVVKHAIIFLAAILTTVVPAKQRASERIVFVVDKSGSMDMEDTQAAIEAFTTVVTNSDPSLDVRICMYTFADQAIKWKHGWQKMPSMKTLNTARQFISAESEGSTNLASGIHAILAEAPKNLTVVIITDGFFDHSDAVIMTLMQQAQISRVLNGKKTAVVGCIGVGNICERSLKKIGTAGQGGYFRYVKEKKEAQ
jgi:Mg-chelatase subunit ChlD